MADQGQVKTDELDAQAEAKRRLALAQIRQYPDPVLRLRRRRCEEFDDDLAQLVERMKRLMQDARGVGLAANQVGVLRRVFVIQEDEDAEPRALVNPRSSSAPTRPRPTTRAASRCRASSWESSAPCECGSRHATRAGEPVELELEELPARVAQHELDHLDGVLILDRTNDEDRREALAVLRQAAAL